jgi:putative two-component system response regulator
VDTPLRNEDRSSGKIRRVMSTFHLMIAASGPVGSSVSRALGPFGYAIDLFQDGQALLKSIQSGVPDLIIVSADLMGMDGFWLVRTLRSNRGLEEIPILMLAWDATTADQVKAFQHGADDVLPQTGDDIVLRARVRILLRLSSYRQRLQNEKRILSIKVAERTRELVEITFAMVTALEKATELNDPETGHHIARVAGYSSILAQGLGLEPEMVEKIRLYSPLHDVGKVGVPESILKKTGTLTPTEFEEMKRHTVYGFDLLTAAKADVVARNIAIAHHERADGMGYPYGLSGTAIPIEARVVAVADVFDALTTARRYKTADAPEVAMRKITLEQASRFDPTVLATFVRRYRDVLNVMTQFRSPGSSLALP